MNSNLISANPMMQRFKKWLLSVPLLGVAVTGTIFLKVEPAAAYCVYNYSDRAMTVLQLPVKTNSFKEIITPGNKKCCPWDEDSCVGSEGQDGKTMFLTFKGEIPDSIIYALDGTAAFIESIQYTSNIVNNPYLYTAREGANAIEKLLATKNVAVDKFLGRVETYNGGVVIFLEGKPVGCWQGTCQGQWINGDGTEGIPEGGIE